MILIRTNLNKSIGLGHYYRMLRLAKELVLLNKKVLFVIDKPNKEFESDQYHHEYLYNSSSYKNDADDSIKVKNLIKKFKINIVILDDYRLTNRWEKNIKSKKIKLIVIDDLIFKKHKCDYYINYRLLSDDQKNQIKKRLGKNTKLLLGPKYSILNKNLKPLKNFKIFNITLYAGGGGDPKIFSNIIKKLCKLKKLKINLIISLNKSKIENFKNLKKKFKNFNIYFKDKYDEILSKTQIYIGCQGNAIYDNSKNKIVSIFYPNSSNQYNEYQKLNLLGHHFLINKKDLKNSNSLVKLINKIVKNFKVIKKEIFSRNKKIDNYGSKRIAQIILNMKEVKYKQKKINFDKKFLINKVNLSDMNDYLQSRNQKINTKRMINRKKINVVDHYNWWLSEEFDSRETYKVKSGNKTILYIWHKNILINNKNYYVGGWFISDKTCKISDVYAALKWQLKKTYSKNIKWIAVINLNNKVVLKLNKVLGFSKKFNLSSDYLNSRLFFKVSPRKFSYQIYSN